MNAIPRTVKSIYTAVQTLTRHPGMSRFVGVRNTNKRTKGMLRGVRQSAPGDHFIYI
jgi:hypothetical protein